MAEKVTINQSTESRTIHEVSQKIVPKSNDYIQFFSTSLQLRRPQQIWSTTFAHYYAIGVIDGTSIRIQDPPAALHPDECILSQRISCHHRTCPMRCKGTIYYS